MAARSRRHRTRWFLPGIILLVIATMLFTFRAPDNEQDVSGGVNVERFPIQITQVQFRVMESFPVQVMVEVQGIIPDACTSALEPEVSRSGNTIDVQILGERPGDRACAQVIRDYSRNIPLGAFPPGDYVVHVNDVTTNFHID